MKKLILVAVAVVLFIILYIFNTFTLSYNKNLYGKDKNGYKRGSDGIENFLNPAPINHTINNNDGIRLNNCPQSFWRHPPSNKKLKLGNIYSPQGTSLPLVPIKSVLYSNGPSINGTKNGPKNMFMFANNQCKAECCPSTYSCSGGCICTTKNQRDFIKGRGNNKSFPDDQI